MLNEQSYVEQQVALEGLMADEAVARQAADNADTNKRNDWSSSKAGSQYVKQVLNARSTEDMPSFVDAVTTFVTVRKQGVGRHHIAAKKLLETGIDPRKIAYLATKGVFNYLGVYNRGKALVKRSSLCSRMAELVHDEWRVMTFADTDKRKALLKRLLADFDKRAYPKEWRRRTIRNYFDAEGLDWQGWTPREKVVIGYALLSIFKSTTGMVEYCDQNTYCFPSEALVEHVKKMVAQQSKFFMLYKPMVVPPLPWSETNLFRGGYLSKGTRPYAIIKGARKRDVARLIEADLSAVIPAVNALQETPWKVNREMLEALSWAYTDHGGNIGKLPFRDEEPLPPIPPLYKVDEEVTKRHNRAAFDVRDRRRKAKSRRIAANMVLSVAQTYSTYDRIYFPHNLDTRGRAYPVPAFFNPQGPDFVKALLEFSNAEPCDAEAIRWIAIAGANAYGNDKVSLQEREQWVYDNEAMILNIAKDFRADHTWMHTSEPFQFLRFCLEWRDYRAYGSAHKSHMVIPVDATNSGLQHYSAMLRDEVGGFSVNLIPGYARQDIYGLVAERVKEDLMEQGTEIARNLLALGIDRKMTKRQVMVVPYAGKFSSCLEYTRSGIKDKLEEGYTVEWNTEDQAVNNEHITVLARAIWAAIGNTVIKGKEAMQWLGKIAGEFSKVMNKKDDVLNYDKRMCWTTPDGFPVVHYREDQTFKRIETKFEGRAVLTYAENTGKLDAKGMGMAVAPNFVHALDANHLRATIIKALLLGIRDFGMVHDSFGVHAGRMSRFLTEAVKPAFVEMYQQDVLEAFGRQFASVCAVGPIPEKGTLDLEGIRQSEFFFS